ncbi:MAG: SlyX family protein [Deltaproteobacteria bacterium]|nr:SlyX family protein [Deltaproteobacteria bacterium]
MEERIRDLEMRFMRQESTIEDLNDVLYGQQKEIDKLGSELERLKDRIKTGAASIIRDPSEETPPPHY